MALVPAVIHSSGDEEITDCAAVAVVDIVVQKASLIHQIGSILDRAVATYEHPQYLDSWGHELQFFYKHQTMPLQHELSQPLHQMNQLFQL